MKKICKLMMGLVIAVALPMFLTSCEELFGEWDKSTPVIPGVPPTTVVDEAKVLGAALEAGATVTVNYTVGTSSYVATFKKNSDDSYTLISNTKVSAARALTRLAGPTVPTGDAATIGDKIQLTLVGDKLVLTVKDTAGTSLFEAQMDVEGGEVVVINTNASGIDCTIGSVSVDDQAKEIKNPEMKSVKLIKGVLSYAVKFIDGEIWADVVKRYENTELLEISSTTDGYITVKFSKELVVETLMAEGLEEAVAEEFYTNNFSALFYLTYPVASTRAMTRSVSDGYVKEDDEVGNCDIYSMTPDEPALLPGKFTINASGDQVRFSQGNLQATYNGSTWTWAFAENQWDYIGNAAGNTKVTDTTPFISENGTVDLFGWVGASSSWDGVNKYGITSSFATSAIDGYGNVVDEPLKSDWGNTIGSGWRTLTGDENKYLFNTRNGATSVNGTANVRYTHATINTDGTGVHGLILFPDGVTIASDEATSWGTFNATSHADLIMWDTKCTSAQWTALAAKGCVFLPAAGNRNPNPCSINGAGSMGLYWTSSHHSKMNTNALVVAFQAESQYPTNAMSASFGNGRATGCSVRLVRDVVE